MRKPIVGEKLFLIDYGPRGLYGGVAETGTCEVTAVKRKWFAVQIDGRYGSVLFSIETWKEKVDHFLRYVLYENEEAWEDSKEKSRAYNALRHAFTHMGVIDPTLPQLRGAAEILGVNY